MRDLCVLIAAALLSTGFVCAKDSMSFEQRAVLIRELTAEFGTAKLVIPRSKKPLEITTKGKFEETSWAEALQKFGPAARLGDLTQITKIEFKDKRLVLQLNYGINGGQKWWHGIQVGGTSSVSTLGQATHAPGGTTLAVYFEEGLPALSSQQVKDILKPILDFEQRSATELYMDKLPKEFKKAIEDKRVASGMDHDMVLLAKGRPDKKVRDFHEGAESEDWIYGKPPGNITFVTFQDGKVVAVKESYASVGGQVRPKDAEIQQFVQ